MKAWILIVVAFCVPAAAQTKPDDAVLTLKEAVTTALQHYPDVAKARASADILKGKIREVRSQALPQVTINANGGRSRDPSFLNSPAFDYFPEELRASMSPIPSSLF